MQTAHWLLKPAGVVRGTWTDPETAVDWLTARLAEHAPRFLSPQDRDARRLAGQGRAARERLSWGGDVSLGHYLNQPLFLSLALVTCSPNRAAPALPCPAP
ncbi:hypothetical protein [Streptomyces albireticuli]|nr:hypothetical protein [Streptomyces albireticuli]